MILRLTTSHENSSVETKPFVFNKTFRYFHGSEESRSAWDSTRSKNQSEVPRSAPSKATSFPRKRESSSSGTWAPASAGATRMGIFIKLGGPQVHGDSVEGHVIPAKAGIQFLRGVDPRWRGGDVSTFISMGGPPAHVRSE